MRINYTLPELKPGNLPELPSGPETSLTFRDQLRGVAEPLPPSWERELRLDVRPFTATYVGPPTRPPNMDLQDAESERLRWRNLLVRHTRMPDGSSGPVASSHGPAVQVMLEMFGEMQNMEDGIVAQSVAVTRG